jgi:hypothetical protein
MQALRTDGGPWKARSKRGASLIMLFADRVKETSTTTGTGDITLAGAVSQFETFTANYATNVFFPYAIVGQTGTEWEVGLGYLSGAATLVRSQVYQSSNSDAAVNFSAGTKDVFVTIPESWMNSAHGRFQALANGMALP